MYWIGKSGSNRPRSHKTALYWNSIGTVAVLSGVGHEKSQQRLNAFNPMRIEGAKWLMIAQS